MLATAVIASQSMPAAAGQLSVRIYKDQLLQLLRALPLQHGARWSVVMNIYAKAGLSVGL